MVSSLHISTKYLQRNTLKYVVYINSNYWNERRIIPNRTKTQGQSVQSKSSFEPLFVNNLNKISPKSVFPSNLKINFYMFTNMLFRYSINVRKYNCKNNLNKSNNNNYNNIVGWSFIYIRPKLLLNLFLKFC